MGIYLEKLITQMDREYVLKTLEQADTKFSNDIFSWIEDFYRETEDEAEQFWRKRSERK